MAGVEIDLLVRDICRLRPGIEGLSETVRVHSIVGRFLEHARVFYFENAGDPKWYLGSADWMTRNLDNRVEAVTPVETVALREQLRFVLEASLADNRRRWEMRSDGSYEQVTPGEDPVRDIQEILMRATDAALDRGHGPGIAVDEDLIEGDLLVEPTERSAEPPSPGAHEADTGEWTDDSVPGAESGSDETGSEDGADAPDRTDEADETDAPDGTDEADGADAPDE
jgi:polyphosphate kinase